jgi:hypothetical protein
MRAVSISYEISDSDNFESLGIQLLRENERSTASRGWDKGTLLPIH